MTVKSKGRTANSRILGIKQNTVEKFRAAEGPVNQKKASCLGLGQLQVQAPSPVFPELSVPQVSEEFCPKQGLGR